MKNLLERTNLTGEEKLIAAIFREEPELGRPFCNKEINGVTLEGWVQEVLKSLNDREWKLLNLRFGLRGGRSRTLKEIGQELGVTTERVREIEAKVLWKLRHPSRLRYFSYFLISCSLTLTTEEKIERLNEFRVEFAKWKEREEKMKRIIAEDQALLEIFKKCSISQPIQSFFCLERIRKAGITYSDLKNLSEKRVVKKLVMRIPGTLTERCLREMWRIVHSSS